MENHAGQDTDDFGNDADLAPVTDEEIRRYVWGPPSTQRLFSAVTVAGKIAGPLGIVQMGALVAQGYAATGRPDLLIGGSLLALMGAGIADISFGKNYLSRAFSAATSFIARKKISVSQPFILAATGIASCVALGGGEISAYLAQSGLSMKELLTNATAWNAFEASASYPKIVANLAPFMAASCIDIPAVRRAMSRIFEPPSMSLIQNGLGVAGSMLIVQFARKAGLPVFDIAGQIQAAGGLSSIMASMYTFLSPRFFLPDFRSDKKEMEFLLRVASSGKQDMLSQEYERMLEQRGHMTPKLRARWHAEIPPSLKFPSS